MSEITDNIDTCLRTRELAAASLLETLREVKGKSVSEKNLTDLWREKLTSNPNIYESGWYDPPPTGFSVLYYDKEHETRLDFPSLRVPEMWSQENIFWNQENAAFFYASPVESGRAAIGDFSITLYNGDNVSIKDHFRECYQFGRNICEYAQIGMTLGEIYRYAENLMKLQNLSNTTSSLNNPLGLDIGHTFPWTNEEMTLDEKSIFELGNWQEIRDMISKKRQFLNRESEVVIGDNIVFTVEARLKNTDDMSVPSPTFHRIVVIREGKKSIVENFDEILDYWGMDYLG